MMSDYWNQKMRDELDDVTEEFRDELLKQLEGEVLNLARRKTYLYQRLMYESAERFADGVELKDIDEAIKFRVDYFNSHVRATLEHVGSEIKPL